jgi:hypothetical protein
VPGDPTTLYVVGSRHDKIVKRSGRRHLHRHRQDQERWAGPLSVAFHPYATNHRFYVDYTDTNGDTRVVEFGRRALRSEQCVRQMLFVHQPYDNHNGDSPVRRQGLPLRWVTALGRRSETAHRT